MISNLECNILKSNSWSFSPQSKNCCRIVFLISPNLHTRSLIMFFTLHSTTKKRSKLPLQLYGVRNLPTIVHKLGAKQWGIQPLCIVFNINANDSSKQSTRQKQNKTKNSIWRVNKAKWKMHFWTTPASPLLSSTQLSALSIRSNRCKIILWIVLTMRSVLYTKKVLFQKLPTKCKVLRKMW